MTTNRQKMEGTFMDKVKKRVRGGSLHIFLNTPVYIDAAAVLLGDLHIAQTARRII